MIEKIILAIAITFSLAWSIQVKPSQRVVASVTDRPVQMFGERPTSAIASR
jgi:hypothetical protein